jgi:ATP-dependent 26S proteasome regulatory subunit
VRDPSQIANQLRGLRSSTVNVDSSSLVDNTMDAEDDIPALVETEPLLEVHQSPEELRREQGLQDFKRKLIEHREWDAKLKDLRMGSRDLEKAFDKTEEDMKALQSVGMIVGEVLKQLDEEKFIVKASSGPRYVVGCRNKVNKAKLKQGARVGKCLFRKSTNDSS